MYGNPYIQNYNQQSFNERIDNEIAKLQQMKKQMESSQIQQPAINQTFQLAPTNNHTMKFVNTIDDVNKEFVYFDTPFFSKDMSVLWVKNAKGDIKTYELNEIVPKDEKDIQIEYLKSQIEELKGTIENVTNVTNANAKQNATSTSTINDTNGTTIEKGEPTSVQKISRGKKEQ